MEKVHLNLEKVKKDVKSVIRSRNPMILIADVKNGGKQILPCKDAREKSR